ncbi:MAG: hypothetical protein WCE81_03175 [Halobacteriota archaeon]
MPLFVGHFSVAYVLIRLFPSVPPLVLLIGVGFPDILWPILILIGVEHVAVNPNSPLQKYIKFTSYPFSHSLVLTSIIACIPGVVLALTITPLAGVLFVVASASHWFLDTITHVNDLPIAGLRRDKKVGLGLWKYPRTAFAFEYIFYAVVTVLVMPAKFVVLLLVVGAIFHLLNANSFLGFTKTNPFKTERAYAAITLVGFIGMSLVVNYVLTF